MEPQEESDAAVGDDVVQSGDITLALDCPEKKNASWTGGVIGCFSTVFSIFERPELKQTKDANWEVPFESIMNLKYLGCGAQGVVFAGSLRGEMVAVKKLRDKAETNIKHLKKLNHDNIVRFLGVCTEDPNYCVLMEYCQYGPLFDFLHSGAQFTPKQILQWAKEIAYGMAYLHKNRILHRDLKSPNILIGDNLVLKVSDFGTSREWNDVSAIMSFTGTVAWMAPEVIRHELCSERVDVWSYGVVLWELLTLEVPYKNMETHAIMWGVGTDTISLSVPSTCPNSMQQLLNQCWNRVPRNRPPFKIIVSHLDVTGDDLASIKPDLFNTQQTTWRKEIVTSMEKFYGRNEEEPDTEEQRPDKQELKQVRQVYEQQLTRANELYMEVCTMRLQLEQRERALAEREKALRACCCGVRKSLKYYNQQTSSSSDGVTGHLKIHAEYDSTHRRKRNNVNAPAQVMLNYFEHKPNEGLVAVTVAEDMCGYSDASSNNNNMANRTDDAPVQNIEKKETVAVLEPNGNFPSTDSLAKKLNFLPDIAEV